MCKFGILILGGSWKILSESSRPASGMARRNLSPTWKYYLRTVVHAVGA